MPACLQRRAGIVSFEFVPAANHIWSVHNCDSPWKQNGLVDRLRHLTAQTLASDVV
jgi:hypothetical protein